MVEMKQPNISDIRLGWIQRFCSFERLGSIAKASEECYVHPTVVSDSIQKLEDALCRPLMAPATSRVVAFGRSFANHAKDILKITEHSERSAANVSLGWLMALIAVSETESYVKAAENLSLTRYKVMRGVSELEAWIGSPLVYVDKAVRLTAKGTEVVREAAEVIEKLKGLRGNPEVWWRGKRKPRRPPWWLRTFGWKGSIDTLSRVHQPGDTQDAEHS